MAESEYRTYLFPADNERLVGIRKIKDAYEYREAAKVDGATAWQRFRMITLPLVKPALMVAVLFRTMDALRMYDLPAIMMGSNPATSTISHPA